MDTLDEGPDLGERLTLVCGSDVPLMENSTSPQLLPIFTERLKASVLKNPLRMRALCFSPATYGSQALVQSVDENPLAHHTLPGPAIPIPRGADFLGLHVSQIEADVHIPLPDANRVFQLRQAIRGLQRSGSSLLLLALHPGVIGFQVRRESLKRRARGRAVPLVCVHWSQYSEFCQQRVAEIAEAVVKEHGPSLFESYTKGDQLASKATRINSDLGTAVEKLVASMAQVFHHWYVVPANKQMSVAWGRFWLWMANSFSAHAHHRLQGSLAAAAGVRELVSIAQSLIGVPVGEVLKRPLVAEAVVPKAVADGAAHLVQQYLRWFYADSDRVINLEGSKGFADLEAIGIPAEKIVDVDCQGDIPGQLRQLYRQIVGNSSARITPKRTRLQDFRWECTADDRQAAAHLAISDVHLGDGSGTERAQATYALGNHCQSLGVQAMDIVGDLIQRDVPTELAEKHRDSFLRALRYVTGTITSVQPALQLQVSISGDAALAPKRQAELLRELHRCAIKLGAVIDCQGHELGVPEKASEPTIRVYMERGNHDEGENLEEVVPGAVVASSMIRHDATSGILFCHGNIWNLPEVSQAFLKSRSFAELAEHLTEHNLRESLETAQVIYSLTSALWRASAKRIDVRGIWKKDLQPALSRLVQWHRHRQGQGDAVASEFSQFMQGVISPVDNANVAAQCGALAQGFDKFCWAVCDGHSHRPSIEFRECMHPLTGARSGALLVNCGKFHGKNITAALLKFPEALLVEWDERDQCYFVLQHYRLTNEQIEMVCRGPQASTALTNNAIAVKQPLATDQSLLSVGAGDARDAQESDSARILLEVCSQGSGHAERQFSFLPLYQQQGSVRVAASGSQPVEWANEHWPGHGIVYDSSGRVRGASTLVAYFGRRGYITKNARRLATCLSDYTHTITDFGPNLPTAFKLARKSGLKNLPPLFHLSHHAALHSQFTETPRPLQMDRLEYWATQRYLDSIVGDINIGFHFERYHPEILTPPLPPEILNIQPTFESSMVLVYLAGAPSHIVAQCAAIDPHGEHEWHIYSRQAKACEKTAWPHIWLFPVDGSYRSKVPHARAVILASGFMGPAELIHLGKPFIAVSTAGHGEQAFNASALGELSNMTVIGALDDNRVHGTVRTVLGEAKSLTQPLQRRGRMGPVGPYPDVRPEVMHRIFGSSFRQPTSSDVAFRTALDHANLPRGSSRFTPPSTQYRDAPDGLKELTSSRARTTAVEQTD